MHIVAWQGLLSSHAAAIKHALQASMNALLAPKGICRCRPILRHSMLRPVFLHKSEKEKSSCTKMKKGNCESLLVLCRCRMDISLVTPRKKEKSMNTLISKVADLICMQEGNCQWHCNNQQDRSFAPKLIALCCSILLILCATHAVIH